MATERIQIVVEERGTRVVRRNIEDVGKSADGVSRSLDGLKRALQALATGLAIQQFIQLADAFTNLQNRIRTVVSSTAQVRVVTEDLLGVANRTRQSFEQTAELYQRVGNAAKDLGVSQREVINVVETLNQAVVLSGASTQAAQGALTQFGQALSSGVLRGEELNSILEQLPVAADIIARGLGVTRGELRKLGEEGKITAQQVLRAFREARVEIAERFARSVPTIGQSFQVLKNNLTVLVGEFANSSGFARALSSALLLLADNLGTVARAATALAIVLGTILAVQAIGALTRALGALAVFVLANPFTALALGALAAVSALIAFADQITPITGSLTTLADIAGVVWEDIKAGLQSLFTFLRETFGFLSPIFQSIFGEAGVTFRGILRIVTDTIDNIISLFVGAYRAIVAAFQNIPAALSSIFSQAMNGIIRLVEGAINKIIQGVNAVSGLAGITLINPVDLGRVENTAEGAGQRLGEAVRQGFQSGFEERPVRRYVEGVLERADAAAAARIRQQEARAAEDARARAELGQAGQDRTRPPEQRGGRRRQQRTFGDFLAELQRENTLLQLNRREREVLQTVFQIEEQLRRRLTEAEQSQIESIVRENQALERLNEAYDDIRGGREKIEERISATNELFRLGRISVDEYTEAMRRLNVELTSLDNSLGGGIQNGLARIAEVANNFGQGISDVLVNAFNRASEAVVEFAKTGKFNMREFFSSITQELLKLATQQLISKALNFALSFIPGGSAASSLGSAAAGALGGAGGTAELVGGAAGALKGFKTGGEFTVGGSGGTDSRVVAFRATPGERVSVQTPGQQAAADRPAQQNEQPIRIVNITDPRESLSALNTAEGERLIMNVIERNPRAVRSILGAT